MIHNNISIIVAIAENFAIGKNNDLLFHLPNDLKRFKQITLGKPVIMGRNTLLSLPNSRPLKNRRNIVISDIPGDHFQGCEMTDSIEGAIELVKNEAEAFIIGGGTIYRQFYPLAGKLYLTLVHKPFEADVYFSEIDYNDWHETFREDHHDDHNNFDYSYIDLTRK
jgi:dihydrofolate reductase